MTDRERRMLAGDIRCHITKKADLRFHDGALPHGKGACCYQAMRAAKDEALSPEGRGFSYNHAAMLTCFCGTFLYEYLAGPKGEHEAPSAVYLMKSADGIHWDKPVEAFPPIEVKTAPYQGPKKEWLKEETAPAIVHHRMGFFTSSKKRLLMMTFYGLSPDFHTAPNNGWGVGRAVREIYQDLTMSPIYFLRYNLPGGYNRDNTDNFPYYEESGDEGFVEACRELLSDRLVTQQWWEEECLDTEFFTRPDGKALSYYTLPDGRVMGVFKNGLTSVTADGGEHWSPIRKSPSLETSTGKVWGQKTCDGKYLLAYNPSPDGAHRWPLAVTVSDNGEDFGELAAIVPEISPCRYEGGLKNLGAQYMRGVTEANEQPEDPAMWLAYSVNKEDMWIARVPVPVVSEETEDVEEVFSGETASEGENFRSRWNLYVPAWNQAELCGAGEGKNLLLTDRDPYDRTRAMRLFRPGSLVKIETAISVDQIGKERGCVTVQSRDGQNLATVLITPDGNLYFHNGGYDTLLFSDILGKEVKLSITVDCVENRIELSAVCGGEEKSVKASMAASVFQAERILFATKYQLPWQGLEHNGKLGNLGNLPEADVMHPETR